MKRKTNIWTERQLQMDYDNVWKAKNTVQRRTFLVQKPWERQRQYEINRCRETETVRDKDSNSKIHMQGKLGTVEDRMVETETVGHC